jgi:hypothetical protein
MIIFRAFLDLFRLKDFHPFGQSSNPKSGEELFL